MPHPSITHSPKYPFELLTWSIHPQELDHLLSMVAQNRTRRFERIEFCGGIAVQSPWSQKPEIHTYLDSILKYKEIGFVYGYFHPRERVIVLFPETILAVILGKYGMLFPPRDFGSFPDQFRAEILSKIERQFYPTLIEELEHGYQNLRHSKYHSFLYKLVQLTSPLMSVYVFGSVTYGVFTNKPLWWYALVVAGLVCWAFLPVWVSWLPKPMWFTKLSYRHNRKENDAKGKAVSIKLYKLAKRAVQLDWKVI